MAEVVEEKEDDTVEYSEGILLMIFLLFVANAGGSFLKKKKHKFLQEAGFSTILGLFVGMILWLTNGLNSFDSVVKFNQDFFMIVLLPPIIFDSAYNMDKIYFFKNIGGILLYAILGTFVSAITIALMIYAVGAVGLGYGLTLIECFAFGALISATDPVSVLSIFSEMGADRDLYALVFGESIFNDAVTIVLYRIVLEVGKGGGGPGDLVFAVVNFAVIFFGSFLIGTFCGLLASYFLRKRWVDKIADFENVEVLLVIIIPWVSYLMAEGMELSGIVSILFCGIIMAKYAQENLSEEALKVTHRGFQAMAYTAETLIFVFLGMGVLSFSIRWELIGWTLAIASIIIITFGRACNVYGVTKIVNRYRTRTKVSKKFQFVIWHSGLRGAIAFALAIESYKLFPECAGGNGDIVLGITLIYAVYTILFVASTLNPLLSRLDVLDKGGEEDQFETSSNCGNSLKAKIIQFDTDYMMPFFRKSAHTYQGESLDDSHVESQGDSSPQKSLKRVIETDDDDLEKEYELTERAAIEESKE
mmetsp:Transcript_59988/g.68225  ORF Transcript_59988/g.68225 Transcript_59988/m.68225 type:complete len:532 (-) Transcript_59988:347-1942(-)